MSLLSNNAFLAFPDSLHWSAQDVADAVPLRLSELYAFDPADARPCANHATRPTPASSYIPSAQAALFRIHG